MPARSSKRSPILQLFPRVRAGDLRRAFLPVAAAKIAPRPNVFRMTGILVLLAGLLSAPAHAAEGKGIRFWNLSSVSIKKLHLSPAGKEAFGPDQCGNDPDGAVDHDERLKLVGITPGRYDLKLADESGRVCFVRNIALEANKVFAVEDKDLTDCTK